MPTHIPRIMLSPGEPAGIGPDIIIKTAQQTWPAELIVVADPSLLTARAKQLNLALTLIPFDAEKTRSPHAAGTLNFIPVALNAPCEPGKLNVKNARYVIDCLKIATHYCLEKKADALVTGPIQKSILNDAGIVFSGHTEFLAAGCQVKQVIMLFVTPTMKVALATTHLPLAQVPHAITTTLLTQTIRLLSKELTATFHLPNPHILVCGLNPHAGENGHLGREEIDVIQPAIEELRAEKINVTGPLPADTIFTSPHLQNADAILAMYHDQALPVVKSQDFHQAVNVTLGLPIIRTSVDHGTALDIAGNIQKINAGSFAAALQLAIDLAKN